MLKKWFVVSTFALVIGLLTASIGAARNLATIDAPGRLQKLYFEPVRLKVGFTNQTPPHFFRAWLNRHDITDLFVATADGMQATVGPQDGLRLTLSADGAKRVKGLNFFRTLVRDQKGGIDFDWQPFFVHAAGDPTTALVTIVHTSDLHNRADGHGPFLDYTPLDTGDNDTVRGGYARLATAIQRVRAEQTAKRVPVLLFDAGDFFMGTPFDLTAADPVTLRFFEMMQYSAITLGNHEFDWAPAGLALLLNNGMNAGFEVPIIATNMLTDANDPADDALEAFVTAGRINRTTVIDLPNGLKVGVLGLLGEDAAIKAPLAAPVSFEQDYPFIQQQVDELRQNAGADLVVAISHGGITAQGTADDAELAENITGIDVIASGHFHTATPEPFIIGPSNTLVYAPGEYGEHLSRLDIAFSRREGRVVDHRFELAAVDDTIPGDPVMQAVIDTYHDNINAGLSASLGMELKTPVTRTAFELALTPHQESGLGNLIADANRTVAGLLTQASADNTPFAFSVIPSGLIRDVLQPGRTGLVTFADIYNALPLGVSPDQNQPLPGYPLMSIYVTAAELRNICEAGLTLSRQLGENYFLNFSGIRVEYNPADAAVLQGVKKIYLCGDALPESQGGDNDVFCTGCDTPLDLTDTVTLYRGVVDLYALQMMPVVTSVGLPIAPKNAAGVPIDMRNPADYLRHRIDADPAADGIQELKEWMALLKFLNRTFPAGGSGIAESIYGSGGTATGRITVMAP